MPSDLLQVFVVFGLAMVPLAETNVAIPFGIFVLHLPPLVALGSALVGSFLLIGFLTPLLYRFGRTLSQHSPLFQKILTRTQRIHASRFTHASDVALIAFVASPLPFNGVWTAILIAFIFGLPLKEAIVSIGLGTLIGSVVVALLAVGFSNLI